MIYFMGLLSMKVCVFFLIQLLPFIIKIGDWALRWTEGNTALQIAFVMLLFPLIMNAIQYYIIDGFIKKPLSYDLYTSDDTDDDPNDTHRREALLAGLDEAYSSTDSVDEESASGKDTPSHPKAFANILHGSEGQLTEDHSPVPPYEPPSSSSSRSEQERKRNAEV
jgi:Vaculolar membrane protein.